MTDKQNKGPLIAAIVIIFVFFILALGIAFYIYYNNKNKEETVDIEDLEELIKLKLEQEDITQEQIENRKEDIGRYGRFSQLINNNIPTRLPVSVVNKIIDNVKENKNLFISSTVKNNVPPLFPNNKVNLPKISIKEKRTENTINYNIFPTNQWFSDLFVENNKNIVQCYPYNLLYQDGLYFDYSKGLNCFNGTCDSNSISQEGGNLSYISPFMKKYHIVKPINSKQIVLYYDSMTVMIREYVSFFTYIDYILVKGSPYLTMFYKELPFELKGDILEINLAENISNQQLDNDAKNNKIIFNDSWVVYFDTPVEFLKVDNTIKTKDIYSGMVRVAYLPRVNNVAPFGENEISDGAEYESYLLYLDKYYKTYPVGCDIEYFVDNTFSYINFNWRVNSDGNPDDLLMLALPHHKFTDKRKPGTTYQVKQIQLTDLEYNTGVKGPSRLVLGNVWNLIEGINGQIFDKTNPIKTNYAININIGKGNLVFSQWKRDVNHLLEKTEYSNDFLTYTQEVAALANLLSLAYQMNVTTNVNELNILVTRLQTLLTYMNQNKTVSSLGRSTNDSVVFYDTVWGGLVLNESQLSKYGNSLPASGNIIYSYTMMKLYNKNFDTTLAETLMRNLVNPSSSDQEFPLWRCKDWYSSMSYSGGFNTNDSFDIYGRETNKIGQIINCYYAIYCYSFVVNNNNLRDISLTLLLTEISAFKTYFQADLKLIDLPSIFDSSSTVSKWQDTRAFLFNSMLENVFSFMWPVTTLSLVLIRSEWASIVGPILENYKNNKDYSAQKRSYIYNVLSTDINNSSKIDTYFNECYAMRNEDNTVLSPSLNFIGFHGDVY